MVQTRVTPPLLVKVIRKCSLEEPKLQIPKPRRRRRMMCGQDFLRLKTNGRT
tara:strand:+ start:443 stop:598 length:156 start_codon:yes stop_codon:yes gene_type:complete